MRKKQSGFSVILILVVLLVIIFVSSAAAFYITKYNQNKTYTKTPNNGLPSNSKESSSSSESPVSSSDETEVIEAELNSTQTGDIDPGIKELESEASSL